MSLNIYTSINNIPKDLSIISYNDKFFNSVPLSNDIISSHIMKKIDNAVYESENTFIGRDSKLGSLNKEHLSTGCKTLLNVIQHPDKCFDIIECGQNVLALIPMIKNGNILWKNPTLHYVGDSDCDIVIDGKHFTEFRKFLSYIMD